MGWEGVLQWIAWAPEAQRGKVSHRHEEIGMWNVECVKMRGKISAVILVANTLVALYQRIMVAVAKEPD